MKLLTAVLICAGMISGQAQARPVLVELFTSQACSSCPPADALLASLQKSDKDILPLSFNVTYWNGPAWIDRDSLDAATGRQEWYIGLSTENAPYTPEAVVDGGTQLVGSDTAGVEAAIAAARALQKPGIAVRLSNTGKTVTVAVGGGKPVQPATVWIFGFDSSHTSEIGGGENDGATLTEVNVVRSVAKLGNWSGNASSYTVARPNGMHLAVVVQSDNGAIDGIGTE